MGDVAQRAGVSRQLASLVLRGEPGPSEASRERVLAAASELDYRPNSAARLLRQPRTRLIGVMFTALNSFEARVVERLMERAEEEGFTVVLGPNTTARTTEVVIRQLLEQRVEALACFNPDPASPTFQRALDLVPVVWLGERSDELRADVVRTDDDAGLMELVGYLANLGHRRIAYAGGRGGRVGPDRAASYRAAMLSHGLSKSIDVVEVGFGEEDGAEAARELMEREALPTAVVGCSDHCGAGLLATFRAAAVAVPGKISVTGYDDSDIAALSYNSLTAVHQDVGLTVEATLAAILSRLAEPTLGPRRYATPAPVVVRASTGPARAGQA
ncbi:LacI family DNA-binding transcriptional regulator [Microbacterium sp. X-17]|uniref:LacI family DNA-binding transcriptional regulator n=1 Tax=Microbacterium sp. X-17 TaxID=3144404 RepID=UPI0031F4D5C6